MRVTAQYLSVMENGVEIYPRHSIYFIGLYFGSMQLPDAGNDRRGQGIHQRLQVIDHFAHPLSPP